MSSSSKIAKENVARINKAIVFIEENLAQKLSLEKIAQEAHFSSYHFHRLFSVIMGETVNNFVTRKRIEKAASFFLHKKEIPITDIAEKTGFSSLSAFSRAFKNFYGLSPQEFKDQSEEKFSKICKTESKNGQLKVSFEQYISSIQKSMNWIEMNATTEVKITEELQLAYISHVGKMDLIGNVLNRLVRWAGPKGLMAQENLRLITIYHDSPKITDPNHLRMSACIVLNHPVKVDGEVGLRTIKPTKCIISRFEIFSMEFQQAWESSFVWMNEHGYQKADKDPFEIYYNNPQDHPEGKCIVDLCIPVL
ncbi:GyrI-like domain-containing protein [Pseudotenacibaculum sp. MALMAid0570]|uniref:AraC family transcriptional regulator n=1 Tax=Pseudotenacibaculum sp. MALMAid0570 TaxID=3143938 RepID=UPI0032DF7535